MTNTTSFIAPLTTYSIVRVSGGDAETFLQGQFSCDVKEVTTEQSRLGTANTSKGRAYATFRMAKQAEDYLIRLPSELVEDFVTRLNKYIVFSKADMTIEEQWVALGVSGTESINILQKHFKAIPGEIDSTTTEKNAVIIKVPSSTTPRYEIWSPHGIAQSLLETNNETIGTQTNWDWIEVNEGISEIFTQTQESFVPQMLNLQHLNAISFKKGCYTGQEIIARMKYLGKLKKATFLLSVSPIIETQPGAAVFELGSDKKRGTVVRSASSDKNNTTLILAVLDIESIKSGGKVSLSENSNISAECLSLPYEE